jgi:glycosyltransferase involved in cell wall biosynthesis
MNQSQISAAYAVSDCLVLPSDHGETWGLVVNEAMACGLPAIVSDLVGCVEDLVHEGHTGMVFPFADIDALAGCMNRMAEDPHASAQMGAKAKELVTSRYTIDKAAEGIMKAVELVLQRSDLSQEAHCTSSGILNEESSLRADSLPSSLPRR